MPKSTFVMITVLFGMICGNRLMDNRLLRSAAISYEAPYKSESYNNVNSLNDKMNNDVKLKNRENARKSANNLPCGRSNNIDIERDLTARNCNENLMNLLKQPANYMTYDSNDDLMHNVNGLKSYQPLVGSEDEDIFDVEPVEATINAKNMQLMQAKLNMLPIANYKDFYQDLVVDTTKDEMTKRNGNSLASVLGASPPRGCDCKIRNDLVDLGQQHFPRYLLSAVCHSDHLHSELGPKCWSGSVCRPLEYKVKVLTFRTLMDNNMQKDPTLAWLPDDLRQIWKFKTVTVTAGCFCS